MKTIQEQFGFTTLQQFVQFFDRLGRNLDQHSTQLWADPLVCPSGRTMNWLSFSQDPETMYCLYSDFLSVLPWYGYLPAAQQVYDTLQLAPPGFDRASWLHVADKLYGYFCNAGPDGTICLQAPDPELHTPWVVRDGRLLHYFYDWTQTVLQIPPEVTVVSSKAFIGCEAPVCLAVPETVQRFEPEALCFRQREDAGGIEGAAQLSVILLQGSGTVLEEDPLNEPEMPDEESFLDVAFYKVVAPAHSQPQEYARQRGWYLAETLDKAVLPFLDPLYELENMRIDCLDYLDNERYRAEWAEQLMRFGLEHDLFDEPQQVLFAYCDLAYRIGNLYHSQFDEDWGRKELVRRGWVEDFLRGRELCTTLGDRDTGGPVRLIIDLRRKNACPDAALLGVDAFSIGEYLEMWFGRNDWAECWADCLLEHGKEEE